AVALLLERRLVPPRAVLAATADVRDDEGPAALEPRPPDRPGVRREPGDLEPAVAGQERRQRPDLLVVRGRDGRDLEVRDAGAVVRRREVLLDVKAVGVEERGQRLERLERDDLR